jgi:hypothetical protein
MQFIHRDHIIERDEASGLYRVRENGDPAETVLTLAGTLEGAIDVIDSVLTETIEIVEEEEPTSGYNPVPCRCGDGSCMLCDDNGMVDEADHVRA